VVKLLIIFISTLFFYRRTVYYGYIIDDIQVCTQDNERKPSKLRNFWLQVKGGCYFQPRVEHTITLMFHVINSCLIYLAFGRTDVAFLGAMLFGLNPVNNQASVWLSGKVYSIATTFVLLGVWLKPLFPVLYFTGYFFSLNVVLVPLLFIWLKPWFYAPFTILLILWFRKRVVYEPKRRYEQSTDHMTEVSLRKLMISLKTYAYYFRIGIFPTRIGMCHTYLHVFGLSKKESERWYKPDRYFWLGIALVGFILTGLFMRWDIFGLIWFTLLIAQWCNFMVLNHPICERYIYLANVGLMLMLAKVLLMIPFGSYFAVALLVYYATRLWGFLPTYKNNKEYFKSNSENFPEIAVPYNQYGLELIRFGKAETALDVFLEGLQYRPNDFRINYNIANLLLGMRRFQESVPFVRKAELALDPKNNYETWRNQVNLLKLQLSTAGLNID